MHIFIVSSKGSHAPEMTYTVLYTYIQFVLLQCEQIFTFKFKASGDSS